MTINEDPLKILEDAMQVIGKHWKLMKSMQVL